MRKDLKREFGFLLLPWRLLSQTCMRWPRDVMVKTVKAAIILDNMMVELHRAEYNSTENFKTWQMMMKVENVLLKRTRKN